MPETLEAKRFLIAGMVQGVGFRFFAQRLAGRLGVAGYVKNLPDGRVEVYAVGQAEQLRALRVELERGPRSAEVSEVAEEEAEIIPRHVSGFSIEHDW